MTDAEQNTHLRGVTDNEYRAWLASNGITGLSECDRYGMDEKGNNDDE